MLRILLFDQIPGSLDPMCRMLLSCGMCCNRADTVEGLLASIVRDPPDIVISHWNSGLKQLDSLRSKIKTKRPECKFLVITPHQSGLERGLALHSGIDGYYIEPFSYSRLLYDMGSIQEACVQCGSYEVGNYRVDGATQSVCYKEKPLILTRKQYSLLILLLNRPGHVFGRTKIWEAVWGYEEYPSTNCVDALVYRLRKRLPQEAARALVYVRDIGYRLCTEEAMQSRRS